MEFLERAVPWHTTSRIDSPLVEASAILRRHHFDLEGPVLKHLRRVVERYPEMKADTEAVPEFHLWHLHDYRLYGPAVLALLYCWLYNKDTGTVQRLSLAHLCASKDLLYLSRYLPHYRANHIPVQASSQLQRAVRYHLNLDLLEQQKDTLPSTGVLGAILGFAVMVWRVIENKQLHTVPLLALWRRFACLLEGKHERTDMTEDFTPLCADLNCCADYTLQALAVVTGHLPLSQAPPQPPLFPVTCMVRDLYPYVKRAGGTLKNIKEKPWPVCRPEMRKLCSLTQDMAVMLVQQHHTKELAQSLQAVGEAEFYFLPDCYVHEMDYLLDDILRLGTLKSRFITYGIVYNKHDHGTILVCPPGHGEYLSWGSAYHCLENVPEPDTLFWELVRLLLQAPTSAHLHMALRLLAPQAPDEHIRNITNCLPCFWQACADQAKTPNATLLTLCMFRLLVPALKPAVLKDPACHRTHSLPQPTVEGHRSFMDVARPLTQWHVFRQPENDSEASAQAHAFVSRLDLAQPTYLVQTMELDPLNIFSVALVGALSALQLDRLSLSERGFQGMRNLYPCGPASRWLCISLMCTTHQTLVSPQLRWVLKYRVPDTRYTMRDVIQKFSVSESNAKSNKNKKSKKKKNKKKDTATRHHRLGNGSLFPDVDETTHDSDSGSDSSSSSSSSSSSDEEEAGDGTTSTPHNIGADSFVSAPTYSPVPHAPGQYQYQHQHQHQHQHQQLPHKSSSQAYDDYDPTNPALIPRPAPSRFTGSMDLNS